MAQHTDVELPELTYDRGGYTALRAYCMTIPLRRIADLYYIEDSPQIEQGFEHWMIDMRANLAQRHHHLYQCAFSRNRRRSQKDSLSDSPPKQAPLLVRNVD